MTIARDIPVLILGRLSRNVRVRTAHATFVGAKLYLLIFSGTFCFVFFLERATARVNSHGTPVHTDTLGLRTVGRENNNCARDQSRTVVGGGGMRARVIPGLQTAGSWKKT